MTKREVTHAWLFGVGILVEVRELKNPGCEGSALCCCAPSRPPRTVACQASLSMEFSSQEYWSVLPFPSSRDLPNPVFLESPESLILTGRFFTTCHLGNPIWRDTLLQLPNKCFLCIWNSGVRRGPWKLNALKTMCLDQRGHVHERRGKVNHGKPYFRSFIIWFRNDCCGFSSYTFLSRVSIHLVIHAYSHCFGLFKCQALC